MMRRIAAIAVCGTMFAAPVLADSGSGAYVGVAGGLAESGVDARLFGEKDFAFKGFAGYSFSDYMALEVSYIHGAKATKQTDGVAIGGSLDVTTKSTNGSFLFRARTGSAFAVYGKVGYSLYDVDQVDRLDGTVLAESSVSDEALSYGVGVTYAFYNHLLVRFEYEGVNVRDGDFNTLMLGIGYKFW